MFLYLSYICRPCSPVCTCPLTPSTGILLLGRRVKCLWHLNHAREEWAIKFAYGIQHLDPKSHIWDFHNLGYIAASSSSLLGIFATFCYQMSHGLGYFCSLLLTKKLINYVGILLIRVDLVIITCGGLFPGQYEMF